MVILGLDVSTTTIGYAYTKYKKIQDMGFIDISKKTSIQEKAYKALDVIEENNNSIISITHNHNRIRLSR